MAASFSASRPRDLHVIVRVGIRHRRHLDQFRTLKAQHILLFLALRLGDDDHGAIAKRIGDQRQPDPGIARRPFDNRAAGFQGTRHDCIGNDRQTRPVLHRSAGIHELRLAQNRAAGLLGRALQPYERRISDGFDDIGGNSHELGLFSEFGAGQARVERRPRQSRLVAPA